MWFGQTLKNLSYRYISPNFQVSISTSYFLTIFPWVCAWISTCYLIFGASVVELGFELQMSPTLDPPSGMGAIYFFHTLRCH